MNIQDIKQIIAEEISETQSKVHNAFLDGDIEAIKRHEAELKETEDLLKLIIS